MMTEYRRITWLLVLALTAPLLASAERRGRLVGKVADPEGKPIPGVTVTATAKEIPSFREVMTTDRKGVFKVDFDRLFVVYHYRFEKAGYQTAIADQTWSLEGTKRHEFTMRIGTDAMPGGLPPGSTSNPAILAFSGGVAAFEAKDYAAAQLKFEEALAHDANLRPAWEVLSAVHVELGHDRKAVEAAEQAMALGSTAVMALRARWQGYRNLGDEAKAAGGLELLERYGRLTEEANRIHNEGVTLLKAGEPEAAFAKFQQALEADPSLEPALLGVATTGLKIDRATEAAAAAETLLAADPGHEQALRIRYNASLKLGDEVKIVESLVGMAHVDPAMARDGLAKLATTAFDSDDVVRAKERFGRVLELDPNHARSHYFLGVILMREGASEEAKSHLERFRELAPDDPEASTAAELLKYLGGA